MTEDRELIKRAARGEGEVFDEIVRRYQDGLFRHLLRLTGHPEEAEDLCQETFIRFYGALRRFNPQRPIAPYLFTIATNLYRTRSARVGEQTQPLDQQQPAAASVSEQALARLEHQQILAAVKRLSPEQQEAVSLYYDQGLSYREIAKITKVPVGTVSTRLRLALGNLRQALAAGLVIPVGVGELPQYLTSVLQGQATAPGSVAPAVAHGISTLAPGGAGLLAYWEGAIVMKKAIYLAIGLAVAGGAVVGVPRLINHNKSAKPVAQVRVAKERINIPTAAAKEEIGAPAAVEVPRVTTHSDPVKPAGQVEMAKEGINTPTTVAKEELNIPTAATSEQDQYHVVLGPNFQYPPGYLTSEQEKILDELHFWPENLSPQDSRTLVVNKSLSLSYEQVGNSYPEKIGLLKAYLALRKIAGNFYAAEEINTINFQEGYPGQYQFQIEFRNGDTMGTTISLPLDEAERKAILALPPGENRVRIK
jgi:RNA polymerase sigma factor (sigma-70 family)